MAEKQEEVKQEEPKPAPVEEEEEEEDWTDRFSFDVHVVVSKGKAAYSVESVKKNDDGSYDISISSEPSGDKNATGSFSEHEVSELQKHFEEESPSDLEGNVFCTVETYAHHALEELKLFIKYGCDRKTPSNEAITESLVKAFAAVSEPNFSDLTGGDLYRYFVSLFDLSVFDNDPVAAKWVSDVTAGVAALTEGKVTVSSNPEDFPEGKSHDVVRDIKLKITDGSKTAFVQIIPASNGWVFVTA